MAKGRDPSTRWPQGSAWQPGPRPGSLPSLQTTGSPAKGRRNGTPKAPGRILQNIGGEAPLLEKDKRFIEAPSHGPEPATVRLSVDRWKRRHGIELRNHRRERRPCWVSGKATRGTARTRGVPRLPGICRPVACADVFCAGPGRSRSWANESLPRQKARAMTPRGNRSGSQTRPYDR